MFNEMKFLFLLRLSLHNRFLKWPQLFVLQLNSSLKKKNRINCAQIYIVGAGVYRLLPLAARKKNQLYVLSYYTPPTIHILEHRNLIIIKRHFI